MIVRGLIPARGCIEHLCQLVAASGQGVESANASACSDELASHARKSTHAASKKSVTRCVEALTASKPISTMRLLFSAMRVIRCASYSAPDDSILPIDGVQNNSCPITRLEQRLHNLKDFSQQTTGEKVHLDASAGCLTSCLPCENLNLASGSLASAFILVVAQLRQRFAMAVGCVV